MLSYEGEVYTMVHCTVHNYYMKYDAKLTVMG